MTSQRGLSTVLKSKFTWILIGLAIIVGVLYVAPELLIWRKLQELGKPFVLIQLTHHGDEAYGTISRFHEIVDGHFPPGDLYFDASAPTPFGPFQVMPLLMAGFMYVFGGNINIAYLVATGVLAPIIFLLFYWLGKVITGDRIFSLFLAMIGVMTPLFRSVPAIFRSFNLFINNAVKYFIPVIQTPLAKLPLGRTEDPLLTYLLFLPILAVLLLFWKNPDWKKGFLAGGLIGAMFYVYFHYWVFLTVVVGLIGIYAVVGVRKNPAFFKATKMLFLGLVLVTIPYWVNFFAFRNSPTGAEVTARVGVETSRAPFFIAGEPPIFDYVFYALLAVFVYFVFYQRQEQRIAKLYWIFIGTMPIMWNVQVVTGFVPSPDHWFRPISAFAFIIIAHGAYELLKRLNYRTTSLVLMIGLALLVSKKVVNALVFIDPPREFIAENTYESRTFNPGIVESWEWINNTLPHEPKIISPSFVTSLYLNAQTSARPYLAGGFNTAATNEDIEKRFLTTYKLFQVRPDHLKSVLEVDYRDMVCHGECINKDAIAQLNTAETTSFLYVGYYVNDPKRMPRSEEKYRFISKEKADELIAMYPKVSVGWKDVEADYVYYGPWEKQIVAVDLSKDTELELVYRNKDVEIYKIRR